MQDVERMYGERDDVILQVHIGGQTPKWDNYRTKRERMLEISSGFGNAEWLLREALKRGYRPAVCGCSDLHMGLLGGPRSVETFRGRFQKVMKQRDSAYGTGPLTAIYAEGLTRGGLWEAMTARQTYATSGARMFLQFECNGQLSGSVLPKQGLVQGKVKCHGTELIDKIDIICGDYTICSWRPQSLDFESEFEWKAEELPGDWIYARVHQTDENYAWSSPFWFEAEYPLWNADDTDLKGCRDQEAARYLNYLMQYLELEEETEHFHEISPVGIIKQANARCALYYCYYGDGRKMSIRWYFEFDIPKIRFDWGWLDYGLKDDTVDEYLYG
jgi:hypothetical protein